MCDSCDSTPPHILIRVDASNPNPAAFALLIEYGGMDADTVGHLLKLAVSAWETGKSGGVTEDGTLIEHIAGGGYGRN